MAEEIKAEAQEPKETVLTYEAEQEVKEKVEYFVHPDPLPAQQAEPIKKKNKGLWIFLACMAVLLGVVAAGFVRDWHTSKTVTGSNKNDGKDNASSITEIHKNKEEETTISRYKTNENLTLKVETTHSDTLTPQEVYEKVNPSTVLVVATKKSSTSSSVGTGIVMTSDGYILTNAHVISGGEDCWIATYEGETFDCDLVGYDSDADIAVIHAKDSSSLIAAEFGNSDQLSVGDKVYAIGNPLGIELRGTMTDGIVSAINRNITLDGKTVNVIQTNAALNSGNSGGPLINEYGQVIGINTLKMSDSKYADATIEGLGFALPISSVSFVINDIIAYGEYRGTPTLGIMISTVRDGNSMCVKISGVDEGFGGEEAGLQEGDVIIAADGHPVTVSSDILEVRRSHAVGDNIHLTINRDGEIFEVDVLLKAKK